MDSIKEGFQNLMYMTWGNARNRGLKNDKMSKIDLKERIPRKENYPTTGDTHVARHTGKERVSNDAKSASVQVK